MSQQTRFSPPYILAIDAGTEAIKAGIFDLSGNCVASHFSDIPTSYPHPGWTEQDPNQWWANLIVAVRGCLAKAPIAPQEIIGISADATTCTLIPIKANGQPLSPALLWMDVRAIAQANHIFESGHEALRYCSAGVSAEWMPPKVLWLKQNRPELYETADYFIEFTDWIAYRLTNRIALNLNTISQRWFYHTPSGGWPFDFFSQIGLENIEKKLPQTILKVGEVVEGLCAEAAELLGLPQGIPVIMGGGDAFISLLGMGVTEPGEMGLVMGSSNVISGLSAQAIHAPGLFGSFPDSLIAGLHLVEGGQSSAGIILSWFKNNFAQDLKESAKEQSISIFQLLDQEAAQIPPGSEGLLVLDHFQGNRTPYTDSLSRGAIWGLSLQATRAHIYRALMEGIAFGLKNIMETFNRQDHPASRIIACGGAIRSPLFMQIYADVLGQPIHLAHEAEASLLGSAVVAAAGSGAFPDLAHAAKSMVRIQGAYQPNPQYNSLYDSYFKKYQETYYALKPLVHDMKKDF